MSAKQTNAGGSYHADSGSHQGESITVGVGGPTSGEAGSTLTHETMAETGGSGVNQQAEDKSLQAPPRDTGAAQSADPGGRQGAEPEGAGTDATAISRGYQDTRSSQAGKLPTGLGAPETGGNQDERDLAPPRR
jgi:hypothetical protein